MLWFQSISCRDTIKSRHRSSHACTPIGQIVVQTCLVQLEAGVAIKAMCLCISRDLGPVQGLVQSLAIAVRTSLATPAHCSSLNRGWSTDTGDPDEGRQVNGGFLRFNKPLSGPEILSQPPSSARSQPPHHTMAVPCTVSSPQQQTRAACRQTCANTTSSNIPRRLHDPQYPGVAWGGFMRDTRARFV